MGWEVLLIVACLAAMCLLPFALLYARRRWLTGQGGLFDCASRIENGSSGGDWVLGLARYRGEHLEWFRVFSFSLKPSRVFQRGVVVYEAQRASNGAESDVLFDGSRIVTVLDRATCREHSLAMSTENAMALTSWLEAAPPGSHYLPREHDSPW